MITAEKFLKNTNEDEVFALFEMIYQKCVLNIKSRGNEQLILYPTDEQLTYYLTDKNKMKAIKNTLKELKK